MQNKLISDVERVRPFMAERAEELIQVQYRAALLRGTFIKKKSPIHGKGMFAGAFLPKRHVFYEVKFSNTNIQNKPQKRLARVGLNSYLDDPFINFINHACLPNSKLKIVKQKATLVSLKDINKGEEITVNYSITEKTGKKVKCGCKAEACRGYFVINV